MNTVAITNAIDDLSISGVTIKNLSNVPTGVSFDDCPILYPEPANFIGDVTVEWDSYGTDTYAKKHVTYTLTYTFCHAPAGSGRGLVDVFDPMMDNILAIQDALIAASLTFNSVGGVEVNPTGIVNIGQVTDPAGNEFYGCQFLLEVTEFIN